MSATTTTQSSLSSQDSPHPSCSLPAPSGGRGSPSQPTVISGSVTVGIAQPAPPYPLPTKPSLHSKHSNQPCATWRHLLASVVSIATLLSTLTQLKLWTRCLSAHHVVDTALALLVAASTRVQISKTCPEIKAHAGQCLFRRAAIAHSGF